MMELKKSVSTLLKTLCIMWSAEVTSYGRSIGVNIFLRNMKLETDADVGVANSIPFHILHTIKMHVVFIELSYQQM